MGLLRSTDPTGHQIVGMGSVQRNPSIRGALAFFQSAGKWSIACSHDNPELLWIDDPEVVGDLVAVSAPVPGHVVAQEVQHCDAEVLEGAVALVVGGVSVHQAP